jgi:U3 small nucleolar RNA-associated protein 20
LDKLALLDLTLPYQNLQKTLLPLTSSLPITLLNLQPISSIFTKFYSGLQNGHDHLTSGLDSALQLHQALYETCLGETISYVPETVKQLARVGALRALDPKLVERTYSAVSLILRSIAPALLKDEDTLRATWAEVKGYLRPKENKKYVRKCMADAWAGVVRKARTDGLTRLVDVLLEGETEGLEAVWSNSMKGSPSHLHSRALPIFEILLDRLVAGPTVGMSHTLHLLVISLVHHCNSTTIVPVIEAVVSRLESSVPSTSTSTSTVLPPTCILALLSTILLTRKGKRFPQLLLKPTMLKLLGLVPHLSSAASLSGEISAQDKETRTIWRRTLAATVVGCLQAGHLAEWLSPGVGLIEGFWQGLVSARMFKLIDRTYRRALRLSTCSSR